jgi:aspartyl/glutamyl-tRNA(Asn/Gln) amidotransferase C subunit
MTDKGNVDIRALAQLARLEVSDADAASLENEMSGILSFVETIQKANVSTEPKGAGLRNVLRVDENPHEGNMYTETLLSAAPAREGNRVVVKQVVSRKR